MKKMINELLMTKILDKSSIDLIISVQDKVFNYAIN